MGAMETTNNVEQGEVVANRRGRLADYYIPERLWFKKVVANMECYNDESFKYAVVRSLNPVDKNPQWIITDLENQTEKYNWDGVSFPTPLSEIETFEKNNDVLVNVFKWDEPNERAYPIRVPFGKHSPRALLILIDEVKGHYIVIKSMQGLFRKQTGRVGGKTFYCNNCLTFFSSDKALQKHVACCDRLNHSSLEKRVEESSRPKPKLEPKPKTRPNAGMVNERALINMKCHGLESFKWSVVRSLNPVAGSPERVTKTLRKQSEKYNWSGSTYEDPLAQVEDFEKNNNVLVNVFSFNRERDRVRPMCVSMGEYDGRALLVRVDGRYAVVRGLGRLLGSKAAKEKKERMRFFLFELFGEFSKQATVRYSYISFL